MKQQLSSLSFADLSVGQRKVKQAFFLTSSMRHPNYNSLIDNLKKRLDGEVFLGKK